MRHHRCGGIPARPGRAGGFTLIEVVLALVILSMLALMVYGAFYLGHRAVIAGERDAEVNQRMRLAEEILGRQLRATVFYFARHEDEPVPYFLGRSDGVSFITASPQGRGGTGLAVVTYRVANGQLIMEERMGFTADDLYDPPSDARVDRAVVLDGLTALSFQYLPHEEGADTQWQGEWDARDEDGLPAAVRISVSGLPFFGPQPWVYEVPIMTIAYGYGTDDSFQEPPDDEDVGTGGGTGEDTEDSDGTDDSDGDEEP